MQRHEGVLALWAESTRGRKGSKMVRRVEEVGTSYSSGVESFWVQAVGKLKQSWT